MRAPRIIFAQNVKQKQVDIVIEGLVVQKHLGQVAQILTVYFFLAPIDLKEGEPVVSINLIARWVPFFNLRVHGKQISAGSGGGREEEREKKKREECSPPCLDGAAAATCA